MATLSDRPTVWPTGQRSNRHTRGQDHKNVWLTRAFFVGDTGFEPVTSSVSAKAGALEEGCMSVNRVR
jgi:hypothetical protein